MSQKYLRIEAAAERLGLTISNLNSLREKGEIRGFADRGTWKFKADDIERYARSIEADSNPDVPIFKEGDLKSDSAGGAEEVGVGLDEEDELGAQATVIRGGRDNPEPGFEDLSASDSDVRLILDDNLLGDDDSDPHVQLGLGDSDSDVRLAEDEGSFIDAGTGSDIDRSAGLDDTVSDIVLYPAGGNQPQVDDGGMDSDSDVALTGLSSGPDSDSDVALAGLSSGPDSDSDVALAGGTGSDSDVSFVTDDSDTDNATTGSDSDVRLFADSESSIDPGSDSDVQLMGSAKLTGEDLSSSDVQMLSDDSSLSVDDSGLRLELDEDDSDGMDASVLASDDSGLGLPGDSGISLSAESGISLEAVEDSGISLEVGGSDIALDDALDSGLSLDLGEDSGLALADDDEILTLDADSDIALDDGGSSGIALEAMLDDDDNLDATVPMMDSHALSGQDDATKMEVPALDDEFEVDLEAGDGDEQTSVLTFDDDADEHSATVVRKSATADDDDFGFEDFGDGDDVEFDEAALSDDQFAASEELDVFDADDSDFDESFESGESHADFVAPLTSASAGRVAAPVEQEWGAATFAGLVIATLLMSACGTVMFDLVRSMWHWSEPTPYSSMLLDVVRGLF